MSIKVEHLNHTYDKGLPTEEIALHDVCFSVEDNTLLGIIGHTGSGKSTLLEHLNGLLKADSGYIYIDDIDITKEGVSMVDIRKRVGLCFQYPEYQLFEETVSKDVAFGPKNLGLSDEEITSRVKEALELVNIDYETFKDRSPFELSGGQKRRVAIAGILALKPEVLILDEPQAGLDPKSHKDINELIKEVHRRTGNITIIVSHNMQDVASLCDKVLVMDSGRVVDFGTPKEIFSDEDKLKEIGLDLPEVTKFAKDIGIKETILNMDELVNIIND